MSYRYILRYYIDPNFHEDERIVELVDFCQNSKIEEVMLFYNPEELFQGYPAQAEVDSWFALAKKVKLALDHANIAMSVNPWTTTVHLSRGRVFGEKQHSFQPMIGETGAVSPITACPFDENWQKQLGNFFARIAKEIAPTAIWIEDDWRLHNHEENMNYGGCLCPLHLKRFAEKTGIVTDRETLMANITALGEPHPWRKPWLEVCQESLLEPAQKIYEYVHNANPNVRLSLMCSTPDVHSVEGRDWQKLKMAFSPNQPMELRPHMAPYAEFHALQCFPAITRNTVAEFAPHEIEIFPELENSPRGGAYSKSATFSAWEILSTPAYGAKGVTINHYDMMGNGIALDPYFGKKLAEIKPRLDKLVEFGANEQNAIGVDVLFHSEIAQYKHSHKTNTHHGLVNDSVQWSRVLGILGISQRLTKVYEPTRLTAISSETLRAFSDDEITKMLKNKLMLDGDSINVLIERGFGAEIGLSEAYWVKQAEVGYAYEEILSSDVARYGLKNPRITAQGEAIRLKMKLSDQAETLSQLCKFDRSPLFSAIARYRNSLGGTIYLFGHKLGEVQFYMSFFCSFRRELLQSIVEESETACVFGLERPLNIYSNSNGQELLVSIINPSSDNNPKPVIKLNNITGYSWEILSQNGEWQQISLNELPAIPAHEALYLKGSR